MPFWSKKATKSDDLQGILLAVQRKVESLETRMLETSNRVEILRNDFYRVLDASSTSHRSLQNTINRLRREIEPKEENLEAAVTKGMLRKAGILPEGY